MSDRGTYSIRLKSDTAVLRAAGFKPMQTKVSRTEEWLCRFYTLKAMRGRKYLRVELLGYGVNDFPDFGQRCSPDEV